jgi:hypothetical protein
MKTTRRSAFFVVSAIALMAFWIAGSAHADPLQAGDTPRKIIDFGGGGWKDGQVNEPIILPNPKNRSRLIMFYSGMALGGSKGAIGKAWATVADPFTWHEDKENPLIAPDPNVPFEISGIRLDAVIYHKETNEYWIYYTGNSSKTQSDAIGMATVPAGKDGYSAVTAANVKRAAENPILSPGGQGRTDEAYVSQGAIVREKGQWYSLYSYRTANQVLPGIRLAKSADGIHWVKQPGADLLAAGPESRYLEWHQIYKIGKQYVMFYEGYNGGTRWGADIAVSNSLTSGWQKRPVKQIDQTKWGNYSDALMYHVATPAIYHIGHRWILYFQAASSGFYSVQHWALYGLELKGFPEKYLYDAAVHP